MSFPSQAPIQPPSLIWNFPPSQRRRLSNGIELLVLEQRRLPIVQVRLMVPGGRRMEAFSVAPGVTSLAMRTARYGTENHDAAGLARALDALGSQLGCNASLDAVAFATKCLSAKLDQTFSIFSDVLLRPRFDPGELSREAAKIAAAKRQLASQPGGSAGQWIGQMIYGSHPYGCPPSTAEEVLGIESKDLHSYFREWVRPEGAVLVIAGDIDMDRAEALAESHLSEWTGTAPDRHHRPEHVGPKGREFLILDRPNSKQSTILLGMKAIERQHTDHLALRVLTHIFGGGASGRLFKDLREARSLTYGCSASLDSGTWGGDVVASLSCSPSKSKEAVGALVGQVERICNEPVSKEELDQAVQYKVGAWPKSGSSLGGLSRLLVAQVLNGLPKDCWSRYPEDLRALSIECLRRVAVEHLSASDLSAVLVGDAALLEAACRDHGRVSVRSVEDLPLREGQALIDDAPGA